MSVKPKTNTPSQPAGKLIVWLWLAAIACFLLATFGCKKAPDSPPISVTISAAELKRVFNDEGIYGTEFFADARYAVPSLSWFESSFPGNWFVFAKGMGLYKEEARDCDDYARGAAFYAQMQHAWTSDAPPRTGLAVGEFWYFRTDGLGHAILAAVCRRDGTTNLVIAFMEPQAPPRVVSLQPIEYTSCYAKRF